MSVRFVYPGQAPVPKKTPLSTRLRLRRDGSSVGRPRDGYVLAEGWGVVLNVNGYGVVAQAG
jgi:hypothetical protein